MLVLFIVLGIGQIKKKGEVSVEILSPSFNLMMAALLSDLLECKRLEVEWDHRKKEFTLIINPRPINDYPTTLHQQYHKELSKIKTLKISLSEFLGRPLIQDDIFITNLLKEMEKKKLIHYQTEKKGLFKKETKLVMRRGIRSCFPEVSEYFEGLKLERDFDMLDILTLMTMQKVSLDRLFGLNLKDLMGDMSSALDYTTYFDFIKEFNKVAKLGTKMAPPRPAPIPQIA